MFFICGRVRLTLFCCVECLHVLRCVVCFKLCFKILFFYGLFEIMALFWFPNFKIILTFPKKIHYLKFCQLLC